MPGELHERLSAIRQFRPVPWEQIPDLGLYMDQVITFITRTYQPICGDDMKSCLSAPMINNYVKSKLIPRPTGKKYSREQIALLSMIVTLKQVFSMEDIRQLLDIGEGKSVEQLYTAFCRRFSQVIQTIAEADTAGDGSIDVALDYAILASGYRAGSVAALRAPSSGEKD